MALWSAAAAAQPSLDTTWLDDRGVPIAVPASPRRIVSILPSLTETVCAMKECQRLVGVDGASNFPAPVRALPRVGNGLEPNVEAIVALKPDLVLAAASSRAVRRLEALGLTVAVFEPRSYADVRRVASTLAKVLKAGQPQLVARDIEVGLAQAKRALPERANGLRIYFEVSRGPYAAGATSFLGETFTRLGLVNIVPRELGPFPKLNPEFVVRADPDVILIGEGSAQELQSRPGWASLRAVREGRVCTFTQPESDVLVRAGPRMGEGAQLIARCIADKA